MHATISADKSYQNLVPKKYPVELRRPESWPVELPERSLLFSVTPYGVDGATREHIISFLRRTAHTQGFLTRSIASRMIVPSMGILTVSSANFTAAECYRLNLCGLSASAAHWIDLLNRFTSRSDLHLLTLSSLRNLVSSYQLIEKKRRFCPDCYVEDERVGREKYDRLIWTIRCVTVCPVHRCRLILEAQFQGSGRRLPFTESDISQIESRSLANSASDRVSKSELEVAHSVAELIDDLRYDARTKPQTSNFLTFATTHLFNGNSAALANYIGCSKSQVYDWTHENVLPSLSCLARISYAFECSMIDILSCDTNDVRLRRNLRLSRGIFGLPRRTGYRSPRQIILASLMAFMKSNPSANAKDAAIHLDVSPKYLRENFPEENEALVFAGRLHRQLTSKARRDAKHNAYARSHLALKSSGTYPSRRKVMKILKNQRIQLTFADERLAKKKAEQLCASKQRNKRPQKKS